VGISGARTHKARSGQLYVEPKKKKKKKTPGEVVVCGGVMACEGGLYAWEWLAEPRESNAYRVVPPIAPIQPPDERQQMRRATRSHRPPPTKTLTFYVCFLDKFNNKYVILL
jgi:hypothetical protein